MIFNNVAILEFYKEYRAEQKLFAKTLTYGEIYKLKQIYNEVVEKFTNFIENFNNNIENFEDVDGNICIFRGGNLILLFSVLVVLLLIFRLK
jgi:hypothetical protein